MEGNQASQNHRNAPIAGQVNCNFLVTDLTTAEWDRNLSLVKMTATEPGTSHASTAKPIGILQLTITSPEQWTELAKRGYFACTLTPTEAPIRAETGARSQVEA